MTKENTKAPIDLVEYEPGNWSPPLWWDKSIFWILGWPVRKLWRLGADWFFTIVLIGFIVGWALIDGASLMATREWLIRAFFAYMAGQ